jgi:hypothetical protein
MTYKAKVAVCSEIRTKHINTLCGQNVELLNVKPGGTVRKETARLVKIKNEWHCPLVYASIASTGTTVPFIGIYCTRKLTRHM